MKIRKTGGPAATTDLKSLIHDHSLFFDRLVDLIPARFYLPAADDDRTPFEFLTKPEKAVARAAARRNTKSARRSRLDPDQPSATLHFLHNSIQAPTDDASDAAPENPLAVAPSDRSVTYEELRQRLHRRIEQLRSARHTDPDDDNPRPRKNHNSKKDAKKNKKLPQEKRKREDDAEEQGESNKKAKPAPAPEPTDFTFGHVKIGDEDAKGKKKKLSKAQALEKAKRLEESKKDPEKGEKVAEKHSWKAAESRAAGVKVHDDPKLLKDSIKKERRRQQKHAEQWKERVESRDKVRSEKQKKRTDNIKDRIHQKKMRRIEKREKKLMRPGFEGRKEGFIN